MSATNRPLIDEDGISEATEEELKEFDELIKKYARDKARVSAEQRKKLLSYEREHREMEQRALEWNAYWERRKKDDRDLWRDKDFANAVDKMSRAGYKGKHGDFDVPEEEMIKLEALYMQVTLGNYDGNNSLRCVEEWKKQSGKSCVEAQRDFIKHSNWCLTRWGWNPPPGWR
ncbi:unnamed protein product, partial [Mesorhabditis belari]|uniref:ACB domain-containing protein n=1 Tax=Mesorhabditis belari TaxID=2138241 RepID=A0AAF3E9X9_9BILA